MSVASQTLLNGTLRLCLERTLRTAAMSQERLKGHPTAYPRNSQAEAPSGLSRPGVKASGALERWCRLRDSNTRPPHYE